MSSYQFDKKYKKQNEESRWLCTYLRNLMRMKHYAIQNQNQKKWNRRQK